MIANCPALWPACTACGGHITDGHRCTRCGRRQRHRVGACGQLATTTVRAPDGRVWHVCRPHALAVEQIVGGTEG
jgi:hypothetical protein